MTQCITDSRLWDMLSAQGVKDIGPRPPEAKRRAKPKHEESKLQCAVIHWWHLSCKKFNVSEILLFSVPNGAFYGGTEKSRMIRASILKREGLRAGAPDLMLAVAKAWRPSDTKCTLAVDCHGLFMELKTATGKISIEQMLFHEELKLQGYRVEIIRSLEQAITVITDYLK